MKPTEHTPIPWVCHSGMVWKTLTEAKGQPWNLPKGSDIPIARMDRDMGNGTQPVERDENAHFIVLAVNNHKHLVRALQEAYTLVGRRTRYTGGENITLEAKRLRKRILTLLKEVKHVSV